MNCKAVGIGLAFYFNWPYLPSTIGFFLFAAMLMAAINHTERATEVKTLVS